MFQILLPNEWLSGIPRQNPVHTEYQKKSVLQQALQLWWYQPLLQYEQPPSSADPFFHHPFFLWMLCCMWKIQLVDKQPVVHSVSLHIVVCIRQSGMSYMSMVFTTLEQSILNVVLMTSNAHPSCNLVGQTGFGRY